MNGASQKLTPIPANVFLELNISGKPVLVNSTTPSIKTVTLPLSTLIARCDQRLAGIDLGVSASYYCSPDQNIVFPSIPLAGKFTQLEVDVPPKNNELNGVIFSGFTHICNEYVSLLKKLSGKRIPVVPSR